jgi:hypothetical protein
MMPVHNHGTEEGKGLACRERMVNGELKGECMSDSLRDRIAAVQAQHHHWDYAGDLTCACGESFGKETGWEVAVQEWAEHVADAVIAELGLREEREDVASFQPGEIDDSMMPPRLKGRLVWTPSHRYITEWLNDE